MAMPKTCINVIAILAFTTLLTACDRYRITLNDQSISEPRHLITVSAVKDNQLKACIEQFVIDMNIRDGNDLTTLNCSHGGITSLEGIQQFSQLNTLDLAENMLTTIEPLLFLGKLSVINLAGNSGLDCQEVTKLADQLPDDAMLQPPEHCQ